MHSSFHRPRNHLGPINDENALSMQQHKTIKFNNENLSRKTPMKGLSARDTDTKTTRKMTTTGRKALGDISNRETPGGRQHHRRDLSVPTKKPLASRSHAGGRTTAATTKASRKSMKKKKMAGEEGASATPRHRAGRTEGKGHRAVSSGGGSLVRHRPPSLAPVEDVELSAGRVWDGSLDEAHLRQYIDTYNEDPSDANMYHLDETLKAYNAKSRFRVFGDDGEVEDDGGLASVIEVDTSEDERLIRETVEDLAKFHMNELTNYYVRDNTSLAELENRPLPHFDL